MEIAESGGLLTARTAGTSVMNGVATWDMHESTENITLMGSSGGQISSLMIGYSTKLDRQAHGDDYPEF